MEESFFEQIDERTVSLWINIAAAAAAIIALALGALVGRLRRQPARGLVLGLLWAALGPILCFYWHLYDARTSYYDWLYLQSNPDTYVRMFWIGQPDAQARAVGLDAPIVKGRWSPQRFWQCVQPYPLYSVRGLGLFALGALASAALLGLAAGGAVRLANRRWPPTPPDQPDAEASP